MKPPTILVVEDNSLKPFDRAVLAQKIRDVLDA